MNWVELAEAGSVKALEAELSPDTRIGTFMGLSLHILKGWEKPACMAEIGRIREREFRAAGAGRNLPSDIDSLDITPGSYLQLVAWDPDNREIVSMYRFAVAADILARFGPKGCEPPLFLSFQTIFKRSCFRAQSNWVGRWSTAKQQGHCRPLRRLVRSGYPDLRAFGTRVLFR